MSVKEKIEEKIKRNIIGFNEEEIIRYKNDELQWVLDQIKQEEEYRKCEKCKYRPDIDAYNECNGFGKDEYCSRFEGVDK